MTANGKKKIVTIQSGKEFLILQKIGMYFRPYFALRSANASFFFLASLSILPCSLVSLCKNCFFAMALETLLLNFVHSSAAKKIQETQ